MPLASAGKDDPAFQTPYAIGVRRVRDLLERPPVSGPLQDANGSATGHRDPPVLSDPHGLFFEEDDRLYVGVVGRNLPRHNFSEPARRRLGAVTECGGEGEGK